MEDEKEVTLDIESTGLQTKFGDKVIEIGCAELCNKVKTSKTFHIYVNPRRRIAIGAYQIHKISNVFLRNKPLFIDIINSFLQFILNSKLVAHNANFDISFINYECEAIKLPMLSLANVIDTLLIARNKFPGTLVNLNALCRKFDINLSKRKAHGALIDAELLATVYACLVCEKQDKILFNFFLINTKKSLSIKEFTLDRIFRIRNEDLFSHKKILTKIPNSIWYNFYCHDWVDIR